MNPRYSKPNLRWPPNTKLDHLNKSRAPAPLSAAVSAQMQRMPRSSTGPETLIRKELHRRGLRYRVNSRELPGRPDIVFTAARIAVFVDGCFWHSCPDHGILPKNNREWWRDKLARNVERDREKDARLAQMGWIVVHVWEHELPSSAADAIEGFWRSAHENAARRPGRTHPAREV
jgi:DNA mismatch endonuclease (patch repair protein)